MKSLLFFLVATSVAYELNIANDCFPYTSNSEVALYHYTGKATATKIITSGKIKMSSDNINWGRGVYFTTLDPCTSAEDLLWNNYDSNTAYNEAFIEHYFNCTFRFNDKTLCHSKKAYDKYDRKRDIWLYLTEVTLTSFGCTNGPRPLVSRRRRSVAVCSGRGSNVNVPPGATDVAISLTPGSFLLATSLVLTGFGTLL